MNLKFPANETEPESKPAKPDGLSRGASAFWRRIVPLLQEMGAVRESDSAELAAMCQWHDRYIKASKLLDSTPATNPQFIRRAIAASMCWKQFDKIANRFGLTPDARAKLKIGGKPKLGVMTRERRQA